jgi:DNA-directed RNA polymerase I, II, and III subunit RPABC1
MKEDTVMTAIIVTKGKLTAFAKQALKKLEGAFTMQAFSEQDLVVNITHHELVPQHTVLSPAEKKDMLKK